jgi:hypothetical protein
MVGNAQHARNAEIFRLHKAGESYRKIASRFGISRARVAMLVHRERRRAEARKYLETLRSENCLEDKYPIEVLLKSIGLSWMLASHIADNFQEFEHTSTITLQQLMDFILPDGELSPKTIPVLFVKSVGPSKYYALIEKISKADLGDAFHLEWERRKQRLADVVLVT